MTLSVRSIRFENFRNYRTLSLEGLGNLTVFIGCNGAGKTNILEGIQLLTSTESFRRPQIQEFVGPYGQTARLKAELSDNSRLLQIELELEPGKKSYSLNGKKKRTGDIQGILPSVMFCPDDLNLAKKSSSVRRDALDVLGAQVSSGYGTIARDYEKVLRYKNHILKEEEDSALLKSISDTLITCGAQLYTYRTALFKRIMPLVARFYEELSGGGEVLEAAYTPSWNYLDGESVNPDNCCFLEKEQVKEVIGAALERYEAQERARKRALVGPHNDKIELFLGGRNVSDFASQGQQRSIVLAWKLAEVEFIQQTIGQKPVLLLDDVMSELDVARRDALISCIKDDIQTFVSATDLTCFNDSLLEKAQVISIPEDIR